MAAAALAYMSAVRGYYDITITIDGRPRSGKWTLRQGGKVHVTCIWGVHLVDCAPDLRPEAVAGAALEQIYRAYHRERGEQLAQEAREVEAVNRYWDSQPPKPKRKPRGAPA